MTATASVPRPAHVVIVDDDEWVRRGRVHALQHSPDIATVEGLHPREALTRSHWDRVDVVVVDAHDETEAWDKFVGVAVARHIRRSRAVGQTHIVMISGHAGNDLLRIRASEAGADWLFAHREVRTTEDLLRAVLSPAGVRLVSPPQPSGLDDALGLVAASGAAALLEGTLVQKQMSLSRRNIITLRERLSRTLGLGATASLRDLGDVLNEARGATNRNPPPGS